MIEVPYLPPQLPNGDRSGRFIATGVILLLGALLAGCFSAMIPVGVIAQQTAARQMAAATTGPNVHMTNQMPPQTTWLSVAPTLAVYLGITVLLGWLGIAAFLKRRYLRPLVMVISVHWLIIGSISILAIGMMLIYFISQSGIAQMSIPTPMLIGLSISLLVSSGVLVIAPAALIFLMKPEAVRETAAHYDLRPRWTDDLPLKLIGLVLTVGAWALFDLLLLNESGLPVVTTVVHGIPATCVVLVHAALMGWAAVAIYRRRMVGWTIAFCALVVQLTNFVLVTSLMPTHQLAELAGKEASGVSQLLVEHEFLFRAIYSSLALGMLIAVVVYLLRTRRLVELPMATLEPTASTR